MNTLLACSKYTDNDDKTHTYYISVYSSDLQTSFDVSIFSITEYYHSLGEVISYLKKTDGFLDIRNKASFFIHEYDISNIENVGHEEYYYEDNNFPKNIVINILENFVKEKDILLTDDGDLTDTSVLWNLTKNKLTSLIYNNLLC